MKYTKKEENQYIELIKDIVSEYGKICQSKAISQHTEAYGFILSNALISYLDYIKGKIK